MFQKYTNKTYKWTTDTFSQIIKKRTKDAN